MKTYESWGRYPKASHAGILTPDDLADGLPPGEASLLPFGEGRSYGDVCLNDGGFLLDTAALSRILHFDPERGLLRCEAGLTLEQVLDVIVPAGWFVPVTPGTRYVTIGGCIANDIHGKNHVRAGTFGRYVRRRALRRSSGDRLLCSPTEHADLFCATIGGLGLTGLIEWAEIELKPITSPFIDVTVQRFDGLKGYFALVEAAGEGFEHEVAWIDGFARGKHRGRGVLTLGNHAEAPTGALPRRRKPLAPFWSRLMAPALWPWSVGLFNTFYYHIQPTAPRSRKIPYDVFFYPLDRVARWNRLYGQRGFIQYQCVVPKAEAYEVLNEVLARCAEAGHAPYLGVLKMMGSLSSPGMLSFPRPGVTLALDIPFRGPRTLALLEYLDTLVRTAEGAVYPAKDARMSAENFQAFFPAWETFAEHIDPRFSSSFWRRVSA